MPSRSTQRRACWSSSGGALCVTRPVYRPQQLQATSQTPGVNHKRNIPPIHTLFGVIWQDALRKKFHLYKEIQSCIGQLYIRQRHATESREVFHSTIASVCPMIGSFFSGRSQTYSEQIVRARSSSWPVLWYVMDAEEPDPRGGGERFTMLITLRWVTIDIDSHLGIAETCQLLSWWRKFEGAPQESGTSSTKPWKWVCVCVIWTDIIRRNSDNIAGYIHT